MRYKKRLKFVLFVFLLAIFIFGIIQLLLLRFKSGDVYPPYSSLRSDPLGTRVFYESLRRLNKLVVKRNYRSFTDMKFDENTTVLHLGASVSDWEFVAEDYIKTFDRLAYSGSRLVISFRPVVKKSSEKLREKNSDSSCTSIIGAEKPMSDDTNYSESAPASESIDSETDKPIDGEQKVKKQKRMDFYPKIVSLKEHWGLKFGRYEKGTQRLAAVSVNDSDRLPSLSWHTVLYFDEPPTTWKTRYAVEGRPVMLQRNIGQGSIIVSTDSYFFSNEALRSERHPELLVWLIGSNSKVVFNESHFGIFESPGISTLIKNYRFHWFLFGMAVVAILFIWKNAAPFIPAHPSSSSQNGNEFATERDFTQGLISLLRRYVPSRQILEVCLAEWKKSYDSRRHIDPESQEKIDSLVGCGQSDSKKIPDPINVYRTISRILAQKGKDNE